MTKLHHQTARDGSAATTRCWRSRPRPT